MNASLTSVCYHFHYLRRCRRGPACIPPGLELRQRAVTAHTITAPLQHTPSQTIENIGGICNVLTAAPIARALSRSLIHSLSSDVCNYICMYANACRERKGEREKARARARERERERERNRQQLGTARVAGGKLLVQMLQFTLDMTHCLLTCLLTCPLLVIPNARRTCCVWVLVWV